jgi:uncharacterized protein (DUF433 family)
MARSSLKTHLVRDPAVLGGALAIAGSRVPVRLIGAYVREGLGIEEIRASYPFLDVAAVEEAIAYYRTHQAEIDLELDREERGQV